MKSLSTVSVPVIVLYLLGVLFADRTDAADLEEFAKLTASDAASGDQYGDSVALSGHVALIGSPGDSHAGSEAGAAYVSRFDGTTWVEEQKLTASDAAAQDYFGTAVALSDDVALIGAPSDDDDGNFSGAAYVFRFDGTTWIEEQKLTASDAAEFDSFGSVVAVSNDVALIHSNDGGTLTGAVYVFRFDGTTWMEEQKLTAIAPAASDRFGSALSIVGDVALLGTQSDDDAGTDAGSVTVFGFDGTTWVEEQILTASDAANHAGFGNSVSLAGDVALVGSYLDDASSPNAGSAYVFRFDGTTWVEEQKLVGSDVEASDQFGGSVSLSGDGALVSCWGDDDTGANSGAAYSYRHDGTTWVEEQKLTAGDAAAGDLFGWSVARSGDISLVGAPHDDSQRGSAYIFTGLTCMAGTVNLAAGPATDVLYINGIAGGANRTVEVGDEALVLVTMLKPIAGGNGKFVFHANTGEPSVIGQSVLPFDIGTSCFPFLLSTGATPVIVANNIGRTGKVGESNYFGDPIADPEKATTTILYTDLPSGTVLTFQGIIIDPASESSKSASMTNAVVLLVE